MYIAWLYIYAIIGWQYKSEEKNDNYYLKKNELCNIFSYTVYILDFAYDFDITYIGVIYEYGRSWWGSIFVNNG